MSAEPRTADRALEFVRKKRPRYRRRSGVGDRCRGDRLDGELPVRGHPGLHPGWATPTRSRSPTGPSRTTSRCARSRSGSGGGPTRSTSTAWRRRRASSSSVARSVTRSTGARGSERTTRDASGSTASSYPVVLNREMDPAMLDHVWATRIRKLQKPGRAGAGSLAAAASRRRSTPRGRRAGGRSTSESRS